MNTTHKNVLRNLTFAVFLTVLLSYPGPGAARAVGGISDPVINEFVVDHTSTDTNEFVEIKGDPNTDYSGFWIVEIEGDGTSATGEIDGGIFQVGTTDADGYWVTGFQNNLIENGTITLLLVENFSGSEGTDLDTNDDGVFDVTLPWTRIVDDVATSEEDSGDQTYSTTVLVASFDGVAFQPGGASRIPDGTDTDTVNDWVRNDFSGEGLPCCDPGTPEEGEAVNTPGAENQAVSVLPTLVINEIDYDQVDADNAEFVEILNTGGSTVSLNGVSLEFVNGNGTTVYDTVALNSVDLGPGEYYVVCGDSGNVPTCDQDDSPDTNWLQNGSPDAVALWIGSDLIDTVSYEGDTGGGYTEGTGTSASDSNSVADVSISRCPDGSDTDNNDADFALGPSTPGEANDCGSIGECSTTATMIHDVQGAGSSSPLAGSVVEIEGVVVGDFQSTSDELSGFFVQEEDGDADGNSATSEGIFVFDDGFGVDVATGDVVRVKGSVAEFFDLTEISAVTNVVVCSSGAAVTPASVSLPVTSIDDLEKYEGMSVSFAQLLTVTEVFNLGRYGEVSLSVNGRLFGPTNITDPGTSANNQQDLNDRSRIQLDDGSLIQNPLPLPPYLGPGNTLRVGDTLDGPLTGVMSYAFGEYEVHPVGAVSFTRANARTTSPDPVGGDLSVASFNVLNYFTTLDTGPDICGPQANLDCRGANTASELTRQTDKIVNALVAMDADVVGLIELENDSANVALAALVGSLNTELGGAIYDYIATGPIGSDAIRVALIYKTATVTPVGAHAILDSSVDPTFLDEKNRPVLAQTFEENSSGEEFTVAVNHLKSKGSPCDDVGDPDMDDGQGNCNGTRTDAAIALANWLATDPTSSGDPDFLIIGDLNSYAMEDPIMALENAGYIDLIEAYVGADAYSYVFFGQSGYLDHSLANVSMSFQVTGTTVWHINADEPVSLDYNEEFNQPGLYTAEPYRSSDHDPVVVGLDLGAEPDYILYLPIIAKDD